MDISAQTYRALREFGQDNGLGISLDESEFQSLDPSELFKLQGVDEALAFSDLDTNGDGRISDRDLTDSGDRRYVRTGDTRYLAEPPKETTHNDASERAFGQYTMKVGSEDLGVTPIKALKGNSSQMQSLKLPNDTDYLVVTVSHGNGDANQLNPRFLPNTNHNLDFVGYTGGDDKVIFLFRVKDATNPVELDYQGGGGAKAFALDTGNQSLRIVGGRGVTNAEIDAPSKRDHFTIGASDKGAQHGKTFGKGDDTVNFFGRGEGGYQERGAYMTLQLG